MQLMKLKNACPIMAVFGLMLAAGPPANVAHAQSRAIPTDLINIAAASNGGRIVERSSVFEDDAKWAAENLIDGQVYSPTKNSGSYGWASSKVDPILRESVTIGFAGDKVRHIGKIVINPASNTIQQRWAKDIEVQGSTESAEGPWRAIAELTVRSEAVDQSFSILPTEARFVRFRFRSNHGSDVNVALGEIEIYEAIDTDEPLGGVIGRFEQAVSDLKRYRDAQVQLGKGGDPKATNRKAEGESAAPTRVSDDTLATVQLMQLLTGNDKMLFSSSPTNVAAAANGGKIVNYSSFLDKDPTYSPDNLIDGQVYNRETKKGSLGWSSHRFEPGREFVTIGFRDDRTKVISRIILNPMSDQPSMRWARRVEMQVTSDSPKTGPWRTVAMLNLQIEARNQDFDIRPVEAKYVRFVFQANGPGDLDLPGMKPGVSSDFAVSLGEIEMYEVSDSTEALNALIARFEGILRDLKRLNADGAKAATAPRSTPAGVQNAELPEVRPVQQPDTM